MQLSYQISSKSFIRILVITFAISFLLSFDLWGNDRTFPLFPILNLEINWIHKLLQYGFLIIAFTCIFFPKKNLIKIFLFFLIFLIFLDQIRLQPWVYFISLCLLPFAFKIKKIIVLQYLKILFIVAYVWSGFHKLNENFIVFVFESILVDGFNINSIHLITSLKKLGYLIPIIEISIGLFLLFKKTRKLGFIFLLTIHIFIIYYLVFGLRGNYVIIPWNILMIVASYFLFYSTESTMKIPQNNFLKILLLVVSLLPVGFLMGKIDQTVSFSLYDGKLKSLYLLETNYKNTNNDIDETVIKKGYLKDFNAWTFNDMNVPFYPENRFVKQLQLLEKNKGKKFLITEMPLWKRNLLGYYKTKEELKKYQLLDSIENVVFTKSLYFPKFKILK
tara:strand:- start:6964 stop:8133 length:1170 start_codon:yes stop_codon:yes gene_type:complete